MDATLGKLINKVGELIIEVSSDNLGKNEFKNPSQIKKIHVTK